MLQFSSIYLDKPIISGRVVDIFIPELITQNIALFFVHGGGWRGGSRNIFHHIIAEYSEQGFICASTDYRLNGVNAFEQIFDIRCAYNLFVAKLLDIGREPRILVIGSSAGAHLASLMTLTTPGECGEPVEQSGLENYSNEWVKPCGGAFQATPVTFEPWTDIFPAIWSSMQNIASETYITEATAYRKLSLNNYLKRDNPPLFFLEAENEHMFPSAMTREFTEQHNKLGVNSQWKQYPRTEHGFFYDLTRWQQREAFDDIKKFAESL